MKILFEDYSYTTKDIQGVVGGFILSKLDLTKPTQLLKFVGYFFNKDIENEDGTKGDMVFILPKVILDGNNRAFGLEPENLINFNYEDWRKDEIINAAAANSGSQKDNLTKKKVYEFIYGFAIWIYRAVNLYRKNQSRKPKDEQEDPETQVMTSIQVGHSGKKEDITYLDTILSLLDFHRTHQNFITFVMKMAHSGYHKICWTKTISKTQPLLQGGIPIYMNPINKKREINFDEELLIIYFSILNYLHEEYGFPIPNQPGYELIKGAKFKSYVEKKQGVRRLHQIRYKYFSDDAVLLWNLCYAFFDKSDNVKGQAKRKDYLLVNKFETVFEAMIDELIGDKNLPEGLKSQADDKRIDHLYTYKYLLENADDIQAVGKSRDIYHIADSKYYKRTSDYQKHDAPKQFTYARNVIQWHMDLLHHILGNGDANSNQYENIPLYDEVTEGFNIIPDFFISAYVDSELKYEVSGFHRSKIGNTGVSSAMEPDWEIGDNVQQSFVFWERLFDRNTYFTLHYDLNFLYILKQYAQNKSTAKSSWKQEVRKVFRTGMLEFLNQQFDFYQIMIAPDEIPNFVEKHYRKIIGKVFSFEDSQKHLVLLYAERKTSQDEKQQENQNDEDAKVRVIGSNKLVIPSKVDEFVYEVKKLNNLGKDSYKLCERTVNSQLYKFNYDTGEGEQYYIAAEPDSDYVANFNMDNHKEAVFLIGCYKNPEHLKWILEKLKYNVRLGDCVGAVKEDDEQVLSASFLILYDVLQPTNFFVYRLKHWQKAYKMDMQNLDYPNPKRAEYLLYGLTGDPIQLDVDIQKILEAKEVQKGSPLEGAPVYLTGKELQEIVQQ